MTILPNHELRKKQAKEQRERERQRSGQSLAAASRHDNRTWPYTVHDRQVTQHKRIKNSTAPYSHDRPMAHMDRLDRLDHHHRLDTHRGGIVHSKQHSQKHAKRDPSGHSLSKGASSPGGNNSDDEYGHGRSFRNDELERTFLELLRKDRGLLIKEMTGDGNCLFRAVAFHVYGDEDMHGEVRRLCIDYMEQNRDHFSQFITEDFASYVARKRRNNIEGNHLEIQAISEMYARPVEIFEYGIEPMNVFHPQNGPHPVSDVNAPLRLSYHGSCHYNAVYDPHSPTFGVGLGLPGLEPGSADRKLIKEAIQKSDAAEIERTMLEDKMKLTDWQRTEEDLADQIARESYMDYVRCVDKKKKDGSKSPKRIKGSPKRNEKARSPGQSSSRQVHHESPCHSRSGSHLTPQERKSPSKSPGQYSHGKSNHHNPQQVSVNQYGIGLYEELLAMEAYSEYPEGLEEESMLAQALLLSQQEFRGGAGSSRH